MRNRPWPLIILALAQIITPVFNIFFNALALHVEPRFVLGWLFEKPWYEIVEALALMPIAGVAIFLMKRWSYAIFYAAMVWSFAANFREWRYESLVLSPWATAFLYLSQLALATYFLLPSVRKTYFNPRVRWWESKPRYTLKILAGLVIKDTHHEAFLVNISEGGAFITSSKPFTSGDALKLEFEILSQPFHIFGHIVHVRALPDGGHCYGIQFDHTAESAKRFRGLARGLYELGFQDRVQATPVFQGLRDWAFKLLRTGKGWQPEIKN